MAYLNTTWDLTLCSELILASSSSQQKNASKRSSSLFHGTCTSCDCNLDNHLEIKDHFNPASNDFESTCTNPVHAFALRWSVSGGSVNENTEKRSLGSFSPIFKAFALSSTGLQQYSLGEGYYFGPECHSEDHEQCSGGEVLFQYDSTTASGDDEDEKWTPVEVSSRKTDEEVEKNFRKAWDEAQTNTVKAKDNWPILSKKSETSVKREVNKTAWQKISQAHKEAVLGKETQSKAAKITFTEGPAPLSWRAKAAAAAKKVEAVLDPTKPNRTLKLTPASVIRQSTAGPSKEAVSLDLDLANLLHQSKKIQIANRLINTLNIQGALAKEVILKGVTQTCGTYSKGGIHIFIDASNIQLGFQDALKKNVGLTDDDYVSNTPSIIFECFSFILERGRSVNKREIVGSSINGARPEYFAEAEACGYRATAPEKVKKWRTKRKWVDGEKIETQKEAYFEQLVDEYIHRQMSNSLLDAKEPGTMVLATGDANGAEYDDDGFLQYVERALERDWKVEVVTWTRSMSNNWKKLKETSQYRDNLTIITLDEFREELTRDRTPVDKATDCWWWRET